MVGDSWGFKVDQKTQNNFVFDLCVYWFHISLLVKFIFLSNLTSYAVILIQKFVFPIDIDYYFDIIAPLI